MPSKRENWNFNWKYLNSEEALVYKISIGSETQGILKMFETSEGFYEMTNLEISPNNFGSKGKYGNVAGILIAFACLKSFELNKGNYRGFLSFTSKGDLIKHYEKHYFAQLVYREKMIIFPRDGRKLIKKYLKIEI